MSNVESFLEKASQEEIVIKFSDLALSNEQSAITELKEYLSLTLNYYGDHAIPISRLACRALIYKGSIGVQVLTSCVLEASFKDALDVGNIIEALWYAARGDLPPYKILFLKTPLLPPLDKSPSVETVVAARKAFHDIVEESQLNEELFSKLLLFLYQASMLAFVQDEEKASDFIRPLIFELFTEPAIKITNRLISTFESLVNESHSEEEYQQFLTQHPVFIDPLASQVIPKQKLGLEHVTDFVLRRLDNEYILVEIERPQDAIFTKDSNFTARFTHAYGQVLDFQEWVDAHGEYARSLMPGISSPRGMLIIGSRKKLSTGQISKLKRFNFNSRLVEVLTYDDLITKAKDLYENLYKQLKLTD